MDVIVKLKQHKQVNENINLHGMSTKNISAGHFFYRIQEKKIFFTLSLKYPCLGNYLTDYNETKYILC